MNLVICPTCHYYFPYHKIRQHQKICQILFQITGNKNNSKIISQLSPNAQGKIIRYYSNGFNKNNSSKNTVLNRNTHENHPPKNKTKSLSKSRSKSPSKNKYQYRSLHQARIRAPQSQALIPYRPERNNTQNNYQTQNNFHKNETKTISYADKYFQNQVAMYNRSRMSSREKIDEQRRSIQLDPTVNQFLKIKNTHFSYDSPIKISINKINTEPPRLALPAPPPKESISSPGSLVPYHPSRSMSFLPTSTNFQRLVYGKTIAIVGPSKSVLGRKQGKYIDSFDIVVRLNKSLPVPAKRVADIGSKTDVLYNSLNTSDYPGENNINPLFFKQNGIKYLCSPYPAIHPFKRDIMQFMLANRGLVPFRYIDLELFSKMENILHTRPFTGTCAIVDLLKFGIKKLFITGLDFYATAYYSEYRHMDKNETRKKRKNNIHDAKPQIDLLRNLTVNDPRIEPDKVLDLILFKPFRNIFSNMSRKWTNDKIFINQINNKFQKDSFLNQWMDSISVEKPKIYFIGDAVSIDKWNKIMGERSVTDLIICNLTNPCLRNKDSKEGNINVLIDNDKNSMKVDWLEMSTKRDISVLINIYQQKGKNYEKKWEERSVGLNNILKFYYGYNKDMQNELKKVNIQNCSINFYLILFIVNYFKNYKLRVCGIDFSTRRNENLFFKFLIREKLLKMI